MARIDAADASEREAVVVPPPVAAPPRAGGWLSRLAAALAATPAGLRTALAVQLALILLLAGVLLGRPAAPARALAPATLFHTLSAPRAEPPARAGRVRVRVVFDDHASLGDVRGVLTGLGAEIVGGPSPTGVYTVEVGGRDALERSIVERLRSHSEIVFAEPVTEPAAAEKR